MSNVIIYSFPFPMLVAIFLMLCAIYGSLEKDKFMSKFCSSAAGVFFLAAAGVFFLAAAGVFFLAAIHQHFFGVG